MQRKGWDSDSSKKRGKKSIIIFDLLTFMYLFLGGTAGMLGGQHQISLEIIANILKTLIDDGAELVFFCDGQCQNSKIKEWCNRRDQKYKKRNKSMIEASSNMCEQFKCIAFFESVIKMIQDKKFGKVNVSTEVECDRAIAKYALDNKHEVLAIVANDTDMLIFEGDFQLWNIDSTITQFKAQRLDRDRLLHHLQLSQKQMQFFATIKGNDFTKRYYDAILYKDATDVALIVRENFTSDYEYNNNLYEKVAKVMFKENFVRAEHLKSIEESLQFYKLNFELEHFDQKINLLKRCLENGFAFQYDVEFMDFKLRCKEKYISIILQTLKRACGTLQQEQPHNKHLNEITVVTKTDKNKNYKILRMAPICVPAVNEEQTEKDNKWRNLLFILDLGLKVTVAEVKEIAQRNDGIVVTLLAILFLRQVISN